MKTGGISLSVVRRRALMTALAVTVAVALPQLCHLLGGQLGVGTALGEMLLPMHLPVMLAGLLWGPFVGFACGMLSPIVSFALTGMPLAAMLPFMTVEVTVYGLCAGLLSRRRMPAVAKVLIAQVAGRAVRAAVLAAAVSMGMTRLPLSLIWTSISAGAAGILLQLLLIPAVMRAVRR